MSLVKVDESLSVISEINIKQTLGRISNKMRADISSGEINYYIDNHVISPFQTQIVFNYFAKYFHGFRDLNMLSRKEYIHLVLLLKRKLQLQGNIYLPSILTANIEKYNSRTIQNTKFLTKIETSDLYQSVQERKFGTIEQIKKNKVILNLLSTIINTTFSIVDYENPGLLGEELEVNSDTVCNEFLELLNQL